MAKESVQRAAFIKKNDCKPKKCRQECKKYCPVNKTGKKCIEVKPDSKIAFISEQLCIGCGMCIKRCPFNAIQIINLPKNLSKDLVHQYGANTFKLHRLPIPSPGRILGLVGTNGIGKSTALDILGGLKPNLGDFKNPPEWQKILKHFRGSGLQSYFTKILEDDLRAVKKPQYVERLQKKLKGSVERLLRTRAQRDNVDEIIEILQLQPVLERKVESLSGGELQRLAIAMVCVQEADIYIFDEPSSFLDVNQRLRAAQAIRSLLKDSQGSRSGFVIVVEHDLAVLDYLSDQVCCLYGTQGAYGVVSTPFSVREGINHFLEGFLPTENMRFRDTKITFKINETGFEAEKSSLPNQYEYPELTKTLGDFKLTVKEGSFSDSEIIVMLGENGTGKSTFIKLLAGKLKPDAEGTEIPQLRISYKPQSIPSSFDGTVRSLLHEKIRGVYSSSSFVAEVLKPMKIEKIMDRTVSNLSGGELQRLAITLCLGKKADLYLIDEPSAYLDSEQRLITCKVIKRFIMGSKKTAFVVEHDFIMATYLADRVIVYEGTPAVATTANAAQPLEKGMNRFLKSLGITLRRDPTNLRPRINKLGSQKDQQQKDSGNYFASASKK